MLSLERLTSEQVFELVQQFTRSRKPLNASARRQYWGLFTYAAATRRLSDEGVLELVLRLRADSGIESLYFLSAVCGRYSHLDEPGSILLKSLQGITQQGEPLDLVHEHSPAHALLSSYFGLIQWCAIRGETAQLEGIQAYFWKDLMATKSAAWKLAQTLLVWVQTRIDVERADRVPGLDAQLVARAQLVESRTQQHADSHEAILACVHFYEAAALAWRKLRNFSMQLDCEMRGLHWIRRLPDPPAEFTVPVLHAAYEMRWRYTAMHAYRSIVVAGELQKDEVNVQGLFSLFADIVTTHPLELPDILVIDACHRAAVHGFRTGQPDIAFHRLALLTRETAMYTPSEEVLKFLHSARALLAALAARRCQLTANPEGQAHWIDCARFWLPDDIDLDEGVSSLSVLAFALTDYIEGDRSSRAQSLLHSHLTSGSNGGILPYLRALACNLYQLNEFNVYAGLTHFAQQADQTAAISRFVH